MRLRRINKRMKIGRRFSGFTQIFLLFICVICVNLRPIYTGKGQ